MPASDSIALAGRVSAEVRELNGRALRSLTHLFDRETLLFKEGASLANGNVQWRNVSRKSTLLALLGLRQLLASRSEQPFDISRIEGVALRDKRWVKSIGDLGILIWFAAISGPDRLRQVLEEFDIGNVLTSYDDGRGAQTEAIAWFLTGVAQARLACSELTDLTDIAVDAYRLLQNNQSQSGVFGHAGAAKFPQRTVYDRFGTLTDQMSAIFALVMFARAFDVDEPLESALACGNALLAVQGGCGPWWFLYDKITGRAISRSPICSLRQCGLVSAALLSLSMMTGRSFWPEILRGISWAQQDDERRDDSDIQPEFAWKTAHMPTQFVACREAALAFLSSFSSRPNGLKGVKIRYGARTDYLGILLYAFGAFGLPKERT